MNRVFSGLAITATLGSLLSPNPAAAQKSPYGAAGGIPLRLRWLARPDTRRGQSWNQPRTALPLSDGQAAIPGARTSITGVVALRDRSQGPEPDGEISQQAETERSGDGFPREGARPLRREPRTTTLWTLRKPRAGAMGEKPVKRFTTPADPQVGGAASP